jgi:hypothetical protein
VWSLLSVTIHAGHARSSGDDLTDALRGDSFIHGMTDESRCQVVEVLSEGWEPFTAVSPTYELTVMWFRRPELGGTPEVDELP